MAYPSIHKNLVFDHLFISADDEEFEEIKKIFLQFECANHQNVQADDDSWEGVYVRTRGQSYLEFLKNRRAKSMGLCQKSFGALTQDARHIVYDFPALPWKTFERSRDGKKWFAALSCDNYLDLKTPFNTWVMHYFQTDSEKTFPLPRYEITKMTEIYFSAHPDLIENVKLNSAWFNSKSSITAKEARFELQTYFSDPFLLHISFDNKDQGFKLKKAVLKIESDVEAQSMELKYFKFSQSGEFFVLEKK